MNSEVSFLQCTCRMSWAQCWLPQPSSQYSQEQRHLITPYVPRQQTGSPGSAFLGSRISPQPEPSPQGWHESGHCPHGPPYNHIYIYTSFHLHCLLAAPFFQNILSFNPELLKQVDSHGQYGEWCRGGCREQWELVGRGDS